MQTLYIYKLSIITSIHSLDELKYSLGLKEKNLHKKKELNGKDQKKLLTRRIK